MGAEGRRSGVKGIVAVSFDVPLSEDWRREKIDSWDGSDASATMRNWANVMRIPRVKICGKK